MNKNRLGAWGQESSLAAQCRAFYFCLVVTSACDLSYWGACARRLGIALAPASECSRMGDKVFVIFNLSLRQTATLAITCFIEFDTPFTAAKH